jgi:hypothetical protein
MAVPHQNKTHMKVYEVTQTITSVQVKYILAENEDHATELSYEMDWYEKEEIVESSLDVREARKVEQHQYVHVGDTAIPYSEIK